MGMNVDQAGHHEKIRAVHDAVAFAGISLADEGDAIVRHHDVDAGSIDMRLGLVIPHDGEAAVSDERCRHSLTLVVPPAASSAEPSRRSSAAHGREARYLSMTPGICVRVIGAL